MKSTVAAAIALALAIAATTASAGVVLSQDVVASSNTGSIKSEQTVMVQGHKQKIVSADQETIVDLDAGKVYFLYPKAKQYLQTNFPPPGLLAVDMALYRFAIQWKKTTGTDKAAGYACQDYAGVTEAGSMILKAIECVASDAPGAKEFTEFNQAMADKLKGKLRVNTSELPEGVPLIEISNRVPFPFRPVPGISPEISAKIQARMAKNKPITRETTVSKIEVKDLPADTFVVPAEYSKGKTPVPHIVTKDGKPVVPPVAPPGQGPSTKAGAPAAAASH
jgi:hypothetical protein